MQPPDLSSSHIGVFNLPLCKLLQQLRGQVPVPRAEGCLSPLLRALPAWELLPGLQSCEGMLGSKRQVWALPRGAQVVELSHLTSSSSQFPLPSTDSKIQGKQMLGHSEILVSRHLE